MTHRRLLVRALYLAAVALAFEGASRLALSNQWLRQRLFANEDASWRLQWVAGQSTQGGLNYSLDEWSQTRGWTLKPNLRDVPFRGKTVNSNSRGVRGRPEYEYQKPSEVTRILILGDSFTFGEEVGDDETFALRLQELIPRSEVLNLGVHGYGHDQMLLYLREEGIKYRPDIVILGFLPDDMERNVLSFRDYAKPRYQVRQGRLDLVTGAIPRPEAALAAEKWRSKFGDLLTMARARYLWRSGRTSALTRELTWAILDEMKATVESAGARPAFAYLPTHGEIPRLDDGLTARERVFFSFCRERGIESLYLQPYFRERARQGANFKTEGHWGPFEHETAAIGLKVELAAKGFLPGV